MEPLHPRDPQRIGPYRLLARLGSGGMGQVYLARADHGLGATDPGIGSGSRSRSPGRGPGPRPTEAHPGTHPAPDADRGGHVDDRTGDRTGDHADGHTAAVKLIHPRLAAQPDFRTRFRREVAAARLVGGAWTAPVLDADPDAEIPWLATAYIPGPSLRQAVGRDFGRLPTGSVRVLARGLAYALQDIHRAGLVHRDLKPGNILLTPDGPRVIDFGIARTLAATADPALTQTGELLGSPGFLAPEQIHGTPATPACDVFGLGAVLAYAATGRLPFGDAEQPGGVAALLLRIAEAEPDLGDVAPELRDLVRDCLRKEPAARPTPAEVLARVGADGWTAPDPWLPEPLTARLGQQAADRLDPAAAVPDRPTPVVAYRTEGAPDTQPPTSRPPGAEPAPAPRPGRRSASSFASTAFLLAVAGVVAVAAGGTVYTVMNGNDPASGAPSATGTTGGTGADRADGADGADGAAESTGPSALPARLPEAFAGTWRTTRGAQTWRLTLTPGAGDSPVMSLTVQAPGLACSWTAPLREATSDTVGLETSTVTSGTPPTCTPGGRSTLRLLPDGTLVRELEDGPGAALSYRRE
ncbi:serine/threonine-protein kinase [Streptomyces sp. NPDC054961]